MTYHDHRSDCPNRVMAWAARRAQHAIRRRRRRWEAERAATDAASPRQGDVLGATFSGANFSHRYATALVCEQLHPAHRAEASEVWPDIFL
jgi:hypothetical protein